MKLFLVILLATCCYSKNVKRDSSSEEEDSAESSEDMFEIENIKSNFKLEEKLDCNDYIKIEEIESCFAAKCKAACVAANIKTASKSQVIPFILKYNKL